MRLGPPVPGIYTDAWLFVEGDAGDVWKKVKEYDPKARLVYNVRDEHLGIAVQFTDAELGTVWVIAFRIRDPATGDYWRGEPNGAILRQLAKADSLRYDRGHHARLVKNLLDLRQERQRKADEERSKENAEWIIHKWRKAKGIKHKIYVPAGYK